ncbi:MAG TPA: pyruvate synthase subunit beta [Thermoplasmatales archaeon]|nr:pyruvate synthase subunit beta [Thermoplasmatales archaeon]
MSRQGEERELFAPGHRMCAGCAEGIAVRNILKEAGPHTIAAIATGCLEVVSTAYPQTAWEIPVIHAAFENAASVAAGVEVALRELGRKEGVNVMAFAGDGGTFDIGFQALSGMLERGHDVTYVCLDNEAYMNTGIQRCSSTPWGASTTTSPPGSCSKGESQPKKPLAAICAAHDIPYAATATVAYIKDLRCKVRKALDTEGPAFLHVFTPCPTGWRHGSDDSVELSRLAVETGVFVLWEAVDGDICNLKVTYKPKKRKPVAEYLKKQRRFGHLTDEDIQRIQQEVDEKWEKLED